MNDLHKMARIMIIGLGIYLLVNVIFTSLGTIPWLMTELREDDNNFVYWAVTFVVFLAISIAAANYLFSRSDILARKIVGREEVRDTEIWWVPCVFRLTCVLVGILCLYWSVLQLASDIQSLIVMCGTHAPLRLWMWHRLVARPVQLALGVYLVCGAPHFVRWQVRKTLEHCKRWGHDDSISEQEAEA